MRLFKSMTNRRAANWRKGAIVGFYTYLILLFVNFTHHLIYSDDFFSSAILFWSGLLTAFGYEIVLNLKDRKTMNKYGS
ncbi:hypothetical protein [Pseudalkalibacillus hwajinpoensis]|uniref:hypothetical protein n=1 Tax=Guptibacillus hwajinpoensis TaxID=208199 RepID=UPI001CD50830|nr:hypothetical protein [Pseudalkalibacillus hwajinpoensis]MCA0993451.1 hypothetical protein [Pseudalkalibacillus hwajinpoensis]